MNRSFVRAGEAKRRVQDPPSYYKGKTVPDPAQRSNVGPEPAQRSNVGPTVGPTVGPPDVSLEPDGRPSVRCGIVRKIAPNSRGTPGIRRDMARKNRSELANQM